MLNNFVPILHIAYCHYILYLVNYTSKSKLVYAYSFFNIIKKLREWMISQIFYTLLGIPTEYNSAKYCFRISLLLLQDCLFIYQLFYEDIDVTSII